MGEDRITVHVDPDLEDLIPTYLERRRRELDTLRADLEGADYETIRVTGHSLKGSGGGYGFQTLTEIGAEIESAAKTQDASAISAQLERLADYLARVDVVYD